MFRTLRKKLGSAEICAIKMDSLTVGWYLTDFLIYNVLSRNWHAEGLADCLKEATSASRSGSMSSSSPLVTGLFEAILRVGSVERSTPGGASGELALVTASASLNQGTISIWSHHYHCLEGGQCSHSWPAHSITRRLLQLPQARPIHLQIAIMCLGRI